MKHGSVHRCVAAENLISEQNLQLDVLRMKLKKRNIAFSELEKKLAKIKRFSKAEAVLKAIRKCAVGSEVVIHNEDGSLFCILEVKAKEHPEKEPSNV